MFFDKGLAAFQFHASSSEEVIRKGSALLERAGIVSNKYAERVLERERVFPTGIETGTVGVALPHTDHSYVHFSQIVFISLAKPVDFYFMADAKRKVAVSLVFMIAMKKAHEQVQTLSNLMGLFQQAEVVEKLQSCSRIENLQSILAKNGIR